ncbi:zinc finger protein ZOP1 [Ananas comosus]|uniref:WW domain-binding protein 4 n=1 Tax=Ananas comosus TaxID=4615 RepID=A0A199VY87_ANACO|nr:zinc finger protein ZOP1 [Ananas comosus]OAY81964.1 WW domain-binding protein 4 [Ananas comosus]
MTEYWVSQGNKWCEFCKIYIANNNLSIRTHELGQRHKDNVAKRLANMRKESTAREKEQKEAARALEQIETKAKRSYQKDVASFQEASKSGSGASLAAPGDGYEFDAGSGYYYNKSNGFYYDANSGLYYSNDLGKWVTQEEAFKSSSQSKAKVEDEAGSKGRGGPAPGRVVSTSLNPTRSIKGAAPSSIAVSKRKRDNEKPKVMSKEDEAALKAREAARKRVEEREKPLLGLYKSYQLG